MLRLLILLGALLITGFSFSQGTIVRIEKDNAREIKGELVKGKRSDIVGTNYLYEDWKAGALVFPDGHIMDMKELRFDLIRNELYYQENGNLFLVDKPLKEFRIANNGQVRLFRNGFPAQGKQDRQRYYEVLFDKGGWLLLKLTLKTKQEQYQYQVGTVVEYVDLDRYFITRLGDAGLISVGKDLRSFEAIYAGKEKIAQDYMDRSGRRIQEETDMLKFLDHIMGN